MMLFIPAYNCEKQIIRVLNQLDDEVLAYFEEVLVVNNRSTDDTEKVVLSYIKENPQKPIKLMRNTENYGLGGSQKMSFHYAVDHGYDYVCMLHGDDQGNIHDFIPMLKKGIHEKHDCVLGARFMRGSRLEGYSKFRTFGNIVYDMINDTLIREDASFRYFLDFQNSTSEIIIKEQDYHLNLKIVVERKINGINSREIYYNIESEDRIKNRVVLTFDQGIFFY